MSLTRSISSLFSGALVPCEFEINSHSTFHTSSSGAGIRSNSSASLLVDYPDANIICRAAVAKTRKSLP